MSESPALTDREFDEALYHLGCLHRPGSWGRAADGAAAVRHVAGMLLGEAVAHEVIEAAPGRPCLVARASAHRPDHGLLVSAPAGGPDGARLALCGALAMMIAKRRGLVLARDLVLVVTADADGGAEDGSAWLAANRPDLVRAAACLTEARVAPFRVGNATLVPISVAACGFANLRAVPRRMPTDAAGDPTRRLLHALRRIESRELELRPCLPAMGFIDELSSLLPWSHAALVQSLKVGAPVALVRRVLSDGSLLRHLESITRDTVDLSGVAAGDLGEGPVEPEARLVAHVLPGGRVEETVRRITLRLGDDVDLSVLRTVAPVVTERPAGLWDALAASIERHLPGSRIAPTLAPGPTDASAWAGIGIPSCGLSPFPAAEGAGDPGGLRDGIGILLDAILGFCGR